MDWKAEVLTKIALCGLAVSGLLFLAAWIAPYVMDAWDKAGRFARSVFCAAVTVAVLFGGAKTAASRFIFAQGLSDNGSYSTNDLVYVAWKTTTGLPSSTTVYIESRAKSDTNGVYAAIGNTTYDAGSWTGNLANATNYDFNIWHNYKGHIITNGVWEFKTLKVYPNTSSVLAPIYDQEFNFSAVVNHGTVDTVHEDEKDGKSQEKENKQ